MPNEGHISCDTIRITSAASWLLDRALYVCYVGTTFPVMELLHGRKSWLALRVARKADRFLHPSLFKVIEIIERT